MFSVVIGGELGYTKWKIEGNANYNNDIVTVNASAPFGLWFGKLIVWIEFPSKNVVIGIHGFLCPIKVNDSNFALKANNCNTVTTNNNTHLFTRMNSGIKLIIAYKF